MKRDEMTSRERWLAVLRGESFDRTPLDYRATPEVNAALVEHMGAQNLHEVKERLHIDTLMGLGPQYVGPKLEAGYNVLGIRYEMVDYGTGAYSEPVYNPLAEFETVAEIEANYTWPDPDWYDYSGIADAVAGREDWVISGGSYEEFATYKDLRGVQRGYLDLYEKPDIVHYCMGKLTDYRYRIAERIYEEAPGQIVWCWVAEDFGTQEALLMSPAMIAEFFIPHMKRVIDLAHDAGAYVFHHSDGAVSENLPQMIEAGIDVLDPVQWRCTGMEREGLVADFGDQIGFHGGMDNQFTLAYGSEADVREEVRENIRILGEKGRYLLGPCHNIQPITAPALIVALYEEAYEVGWQ